MPENTATVEAEAPETEVAPPADELLQVTINNVPAEHLYKTILPKKGRRTSDKLQVIFKMPLDVPNPFANFAKIVGISAFVKAVYDDVVKAACVHATKFAETDQGLSIVKFGEGIADYFTSVSRGGSGIREAKKKFVALTHEVTPYIIAQMNPDERNKFTTEENKYWQNKVLEWKDLEAKVFGSAQTKKRTAKGAAAAVPAEAEEEEAA